MQLGSKERAQLIGIIAKTGEERAGREAVNKEPLCTGGPGTRPRLQPNKRGLFRAREDKQTAGQKPDLHWERAGAKGLAGSWVLPRVCRLPVWRAAPDPRPSLHRGRTVPSPPHPRGRGPRRAWQSAGSAPGQEMKDSPTATAISRTGNFKSRKCCKKPALVLKKAIGRCSHCTRSWHSGSRGIAHVAARGGSSSCPRLGCSLRRKEK